MTPEQINATIAGACGWVVAFPPNEPPHPQTRKGGILLPYYVVHKTTGERLMYFPNYHGDLDAIHGAEKVLLRHGPRSEFLTYCNALVSICGSWSDALIATAAQRSEAFLKTLGLWEEGKP